ncbi:MAG: cell division protein FtsW [Rickettsiaceae bacterium H1]|nr:cell division protein FtsW [Rickettsiaceae bacterium H1]
MARNNFVSRWWRSVDKFLFVTTAFISAIGLILITSASPSVAQKIKLEPNYFIYRHLIYLSLSFLVMFLVSNSNEIKIRYLVVSGFIISVFLLTAVLYSGTEIKGAHRWLRIFGVSIQPSEFTKTFFAGFNAILLSRKDKSKYVFSLITYLSIITLIVSEPDFGMSAIITGIFISQLFICGISLRYITLAGIIMILGGFLSYFTIPHIKNRIDNFLNPSLEGNFQVNKSLEAFRNGGLTGVGPGEGKVKLGIPDSHTDFIFAVSGEEFGGLFCLLITFLFLFFTIKSLSHIVYSQNSFRTIIIIGLVIQIILPALINMGVSLNLLPTKGMVLPFISYGGSSMIANNIAVGIILSLTKIKFFGDIRQ